MKKQVLFVVMSLLLVNIKMVAQQPTATMKLDSVWGCPGDTITMPIKVYGVSRYGIQTFDLQFEVGDTSVLEPILLGWDHDKQQGEPLITDIDPAFQRAGNLISRYNLKPYHPVNNGALIFSYMLRRESSFLPDGTVLMKLNFRFKKMPTGPIPITFRTGQITYDFKQYKVETQTVGLIYSKEVPSVKIDDKKVDPEIPEINVRMCVDQNLPLTASGAQRYEWRLHPTNSRHYGYRPSDDKEVFDRRDVFNPVFTPATSIAMQYQLMVRGYNEDGCYSEDSIEIHAMWKKRLIHQPEEYYFLPKGSKIDLELLFPEPEAYDINYTPYTYRWFPENKVENPHDSVTKSREINEPTWFSGQAIDKNNCVQTVNVKVDVYGDTLFGSIEKDVDAFCGAEGETKNAVTLAALVKGGFDDKSYEWSFQKLYNGKEPKFTNGAHPDYNTSTSKTTILEFYGTTEISVVITDNVKLNSIRLVDTIFVESVKPLAITIDMDEDSKRQAEEGYCVMMPITFIAKVENAGNNPKILWEIDGYRARYQNGKDMIGDTVTFPSIDPERRVRAVVYAANKCPDKPYAYSNEIDPETQFYQFTLVHVYDSTGINYNKPGCNEDSTRMLIYAYNLGIDGLFQVFRNDELIEEFRHNGEQVSDFSHYVKTYNYWDRFKVRFFNTSCNCLIQNGLFSNYIMPKRFTTPQIKMPNIVSDMGGDTICSNAEGTYAFRLTGMEQFGRNTTVIWMLNDKEWGRYEFSQDVSDHLTNPPAKHADKFVINEAFDQAEDESFSEKYAFWLNAENFPKVGEDIGPGDSLWAIVVIRSECGTEPTIVIDTVKPILPTFVVPENATLNVSADPIICKGGEATVEATIEHAGPRAMLHWYWNSQKIDSGVMSCTVKNPKQGDSLIAVLSSTYKCALNLPLTVVKTVVVNNLPTLEIQKDTTICEGDAIILQPIAKTAISYQWSPDPTLKNVNARNPEVTPTTVTKYYLTVTDALGCQSSDSMIVRPASRDRLTAEIKLADQGDTLICKTKQIQLEANFTPKGDGTGPTQGRWFKNGFALNEYGSQMNTTFVQDGDVYHYQVTKPELNSCYPRTAKSNEITIHVIPQVKAEIIVENDDLEICDDEDSVVLYVHNTQGITYNWTSADETFSSSESMIKVRPDVNTTYKLYITDPRNICFDNAYVEVLVNPYVKIESVVTLRNRTEPAYCANADNTFVFDVKAVQAGRSPIYDWYVQGQKVSSLNPVTFTGKLAGGDEVYCVVTASEDVHTCGDNFAKSPSIIIVKRPIPEGTISGDTTVCPNETVPLFANVEGNVTYRWTPSTGLLTADSIPNPITKVDQTTRYSLRIEDEYGCHKDIDYATVTVIKTPNPLNIAMSGQTDSLCFGESMDLTVEANHPAEYQWYVNGIEQGNTTTSMNFAPKNGDSVYARVNASDIKCLKDSIQQTDVFVAHLLERPTVQLLQDAAAMCRKDTVEFTAQSPETNNFRWRELRAVRGGYYNNGTVQLSPGTTRWFEVRSFIGNCLSELDSFLITVTPIPLTPQVKDTVACPNAPISIKAYVPYESVLYSWYSSDNLTNTIATGAVLPNVGPGTYVVFAKNLDNDCRSQKYVKIEEALPSKADFNVLTETILAKENIEFENLSQDWVNAYWNFGDTNKFEENNETSLSHLYWQIGTYPLTLIVKSPDGCLDTLTKNVIVTPQMTGIWVPSAFVPSSQNIDDQILKVYGEIASLKFTVSSLDGKILFSTQTPNQGWDGTYQGKEMPMGTYMYNVIAKMTSGEEVATSGNAKLIR